MYDSIWYNSLTKPFLTPTAYIFAPIWIALYTTLLVALILYAINFSRTKKLKGYIYFIVQLLLNLAGSPAFFVLHNIRLALCIVVLLDIFVLLMIIRFFRVCKIAGIILIPYFIWILFATYLNVSFLILNYSKNFF